MDRKYQITDRAVLLMSDNTQCATGEELGVLRIGYFQSEDCIVCYSSLEKQRRDNVAFIVKNSTARTVLGNIAISDQILIRLHG